MPAMAIGAPLMAIVAGWSMRAMVTGTPAPGVSALRLLEALIPHARAAGKQVLVAGIGAGNGPSVPSHDSFGFARAGLMHKVGFRFGRWPDLIFIQRMVQAAGRPGAYSPAVTRVPVARADASGGDISGTEEDRRIKGGRRSGCCRGACRACAGMPAGLAVRRVRCCRCRSASASSMAGRQNNS